MGKIFLIGIVVVGAFAVWKMREMWNRQFHLDEKPVERSVAVSESPQRESVNAKVEPDPGVAQRAKEIVIRAQAWSKEWIMVEEWGKVMKGELLEDGSRLISWEKVGSWWVVVVDQGGKFIEGRFERLAETAKRRSADLMTNAATLASAAPGMGFFGPSEAPQK